MQLSWKNIFSGYQRGGKSFFPDRLACFSFDLILFSKLLTEALLDPETNQLVLISAVLVWVSTVLTSEHYCIGQNNTHQLTGGSEKTISGADTWTQSLRLGLAGKQQPSVSNKLVVNIYIWNMENEFQAFMCLVKCCLSWGLSLLVPSAFTDYLPLTWETFLAKLR